MDGWIVHVFGCKGRSVLIEAFLGAFEIPIFLCVPQCFPDEVDCEERVFQGDSTSWLFATVRFDKRTPGEVELDTCEDAIRERKKERNNSELQIGQHGQVYLTSIFYPNGPISIILVTQGTRSSLTTCRI